MNFPIKLLFLLVAFGAIQLTNAHLSDQEMAQIETNLKADFNLTLNRRLAHGLFGVVYEGIINGNLYLAIKLSSSKSYAKQETWIYLVDSEWECHHLTTHPNLVTVLRYAEYPLQSYTIRATFSELLGPNLRHLFKLTNGGMPRSVVYRIAHQISSALAHLHSLHVTHHDVKLENIVMVGRPNPYRDLAEQLQQATYKLIDLGLCWQYEDRAAKEFDYRPGDLRYCSPDKRNASLPYDAFSADAYALGATLAWALIGQPTLMAIEGELKATSSQPAPQISQMDTIYAIYRSKYLPQSLYGDSLIPLIGKLLEPSETERFSVEEFRYYLK